MGKERLSWRAIECGYRERQETEIKRGVLLWGKKG